MPDDLVQKGHGGGRGLQKACICIDLLTYTLYMKYIKLWLDLNLKKMLC